MFRNFFKPWTAAVAAVLAATGVAYGLQVIQDSSQFQGDVTFQTGTVAFGSGLTAVTFAKPLSGTTPVGAVTGQTNSASYLATCGNPAKVSTDGTDATPVATEFYFAEIQAVGQTSVTGVAVMNGTVASGNIKVGLADSTGAIVATSASTAMAGTDVYQRIPFTATYTMNGPAQYYVLEFIDNGTARVNTLTFGNCDTGKATGQVFATGFTTFAAPSTFTTALGPIASLY